MNAANMKLRRERKYQSVSALEMARAIGIAESSYWSKESGNRPFRQSEITAILKKLKKPYEDLFGED
jgi:transcriptional regulator with XRE-family HTH domain